MNESRMLDLMETTERLEAVAEALEASAARLAEQEAVAAALAQHEAVAAVQEGQHALGPIVATAASERELALARREEELTQRLAAAEERIATLTAAAATGRGLQEGGLHERTLQSGVQSGPHERGRKTLSAATTSLLAKQGVRLDAEADSRGSMSLEAGALDAALTTLSIEQRFAVKAELLRSGLLG